MGKLCRLVEGGIWRSLDDAGGLERYGRIEAGHHFACICTCNNIGCVVLMMGFKF